MVTQFRDDPGSNPGTDTFVSVCFLLFVGFALLDKNPFRVEAVLKKCSRTLRIYLTYLTMEVHTASFTKASTKDLSATSLL